MSNEKLSQPQAHVIDVLATNEGSYLHESRLYHWSKVISADNEILIISIHKPTVEALKRKNIIVLFDKEGSKYILNPEIKFK